MNLSPIRLQLPKRELLLRVVSSSNQTVTLLLALTSVIIAMSSYTSLIPYQVGLMNFSGISASELPIYIKEQETRELSCEGCLNGEALDFDFTMAFQPLIDLSQKCTFVWCSWHYFRQDLHADSKRSSQIQIWKIWVADLAVI